MRSNKPRELYELALAITTLAAVLTSTRLIACGISSISKIRRQRMICTIRPAIVISTALTGEESTLKTANLILNL